MTERSQILNDVAGLLQRSTDEFLPLSVRYGAAEAAVAYIEAWSGQEGPNE